MLIFKLLLCHFNIKKHLFIPLKIKVKKYTAWADHNFQINTQWKHSIYAAMFTLFVFVYRGSSTNLTTGMRPKLIVNKTPMIEQQFW